MCTFYKDCNECKNILESWFLIKLSKKELKRKTSNNVLIISSTEKLYAVNC